MRNLAAHSRTATATATCEALGKARYQECFRAHSAVRKGSGLNELLTRIRKRETYARGFIVGRLDIHAAIREAPRICPSSRRAIASRW